MDFENLKYLVVGAGFFGSVVAERIAADLGERVLVIDKRSHTGGNSHSEIDSATGIECHRYGSHIFHTADREVWDYVNRFCTFNSYRHRVLTNRDGTVYQMPINLATINSFYGRTFTPGEAGAFLGEEIAKSRVADPANLEEKAISLIGRPLYEAFVKGYTVKQWGIDPTELPPGIITRLPVRTSYKSDYFDDPWQGIPLQGYQRLFDRLLGHPNIEVRLECDFFELRDLLPRQCRIIFTGPIDRFFEYRYGELGWRTLLFEKEICQGGDFQGTTVMNYADLCVPYTRIHEFRHYHPERRYPDDRTVIYREYSTAVAAAANPYYPVNTSRDREILALYRQEAEASRNVVFGGRLGGYRYLDMDRAIREALDLYEKRIKRWDSSGEGGAGLLAGHDPVAA